jgi:hypothetical protein
MIKNTEIGTIPVDTTDIVFFSMDSIVEIANKLGIDADTLIDFYDGLSCGFNSDGEYGVDRLTAVNDDGTTCSVIIIGNNSEQFVRFLNKEEPTFEEFYSSQPTKSDDPEWFDAVVDDYKKLIGA